MSITIQNNKPTPTYTTRVYVEDTDYVGVVYYANYLKFMERARTEFLLQLGFNLPELERNGYLIVIFKVELIYTLPAKLNDELEVTADISHVGNTSFTFSQLVRNKKNNNCVYCQGEIKLVCIDKQTQQPVRIPQAIREKLI